jgi:hypothetical protein
MAITTSSNCLSCCPVGATSSNCLSCCHDNCHPLQAAVTCSLALTKLPCTSSLSIFSQSRIGKPTRHCRLDSTTCGRTKFVKACLIVCLAASAAFVAHTTATCFAYFGSLMEVIHISTLDPCLEPLTCRHPKPPQHWQHRDQGQAVQQYLACDLSRCIACY